MEPNYGYQQRPAGFDFGWVLGKGFSVFFRQFPVFMLMALIVFSPLFIYGYTLAYPGSDFHGVWAQLEQTGVFTLVLTVAGFILQPLLSGAVISATVDELSGRRAGMGRSFAIGLSRMIPTLAVSLLVFVCTIFGGVILIVGAYVIACMLYVAVPVSVIEKPGVFKSLSRSAELTKGYRWWVFLTILVTGAIVGIPAAIAEFGVVPHEEVGRGVRIIAENGWGTYKWLHITLATVGGAFAGCVHGTLYVHLRTLKDGVGVDHLAKVFD